MKKIMVGIIAISINLSLSGAERGATYGRKLELGSVLQVLNYKETFRSLSQQKDPQSKKSLSDRVQCVFFDNNKKCMQWWRVNSDSKNHDAGKREIHLSRLSQRDKSSGKYKVRHDLKLVGMLAGQVRSRPFEFGIMAATDAPDDTYILIALPEVVSSFTRFGKKLADEKKDN